MNGPLWLTLISTFGLLALAGVITQQPHRTRFTESLVLLCAAFASWTVADRAFRVTELHTWHWLDLACSPWVPVAALQVALNFAGPNAKSNTWLRRTYRGVQLAFIVISMGAFAAVFLPRHRPFVDAIWTATFLTGLVPVVLLALLALESHASRTAGDERSRSWALGLCVALGGLAGASELFAGVELAGGVLVPRLGALASLSTVAIVAWLAQAKGLAQPLSRGTHISILSAALVPPLLFFALWSLSDAAAAFVVYGLSSCLVLIAMTTHGWLRVARRAQLRVDQLTFAGRMSAQLAHDLRNPLAAMKISLEVMSNYKDGDLPLDPTGELLPLLSAQVRRLEELSQRYVKLATMGPLHRDRCRPIDLVDEAIGLAHSSAKVSNEVPDKTYIIADARLIAGALSNLIANAETASPGEVCLTLTSDANQVVVSVRDKGPGMTPRDIELARSGFYTTKADGTGLGISFAHAVAKAHRGYLELDGNDGLVAALVLPRGT